MDCYWWTVLADLSLLTAGFFATMWWFGRRRFKRQVEMWHDYVANVGNLQNELANLEWERYQHQQRMQKQQDE